MNSLNPIMDQYANGIITRQELEKAFKNIGFSEQTINTYMRWSDEKKEKVQAEIESGIDVLRFQIPFESCFSRSSHPSGSLGGGRRNDE